MANYTFIHEPIPPERAEKYRRRRWREDGVVDLAQGFTFKTRGRQGSIYYREGDKTLELVWEMSGVPEYDILLHLAGLTTWVLPQTEALSEADAARIEEALRAWLKAMNYRAELIRNPIPNLFWLASS